MPVESRHQAEPDLLIPRRDTVNQKTLDTYYHLKPFIPRWFQIRLRRTRAKLILRSQKNIWPIDENAATSPNNWKGWPGGKRFAFIVTHDVDTAVGRDRCRHLARLEQDFGFRSSFNFVPERYDVGEELRNDLSRNGFEIGVHGLKHDGKYLRSRKIWEERAKKINGYIEKWKSAGYRMPCVQSNLDWMHDLNVLYDASTFDTDPLEPKPDGVGTIFPFWVPGLNGNKGFVEIPYTLPQDFSLFIILKQKSIDIWKKKLDWIAEKGGMALILTHPDYMNPGSSKNRAEEYPIRYYLELLRYVHDTYKNSFYHVLPRDLAKFWLENHTHPGDRGAARA